VAAPPSATLRVITAHRELHAPRRLAEAAAALGVTFEFVAPDPWWVRGEAARTAPGGAAGGVVFARPGPFTLVAVLRTLRRLARGGSAVAQSRRTLLDACDQWRSLRRLSAAGIAVPATRLVRRPDELDAALEEVAGPPWFVKGRRGSQGSQVRLAADRAEARRWAGLFWGTGASLLVQEDLRPSGRVERHLVVGGDVVASAVAIPARGEFRTNAHRGGRFVAIEWTGERSRPAELARRATAAIGLPFAAIDTIGGDAPRVLDVNASPGLEALEAATGRDLATPIVAALVAAGDAPA
jgi:ribosomal protein S6--L-glutamate ligase